METCKETCISGGGLHSVIWLGVGTSRGTFTDSSSSVTTHRFACVHIYELACNTRHSGYTNTSHAELAFQPSLIS